MKAGPECLDCLWKLSRQATGLATSDPKVRSRIDGEVSRILGRFSEDIVPSDFGNQLHRTIREISENPDPYREQKLREIETARLAFSKIRPRGDLRSCVEIAAQGNAIDFFVDPKSLDRELSGRPNFTIDDIAKLEGKLEGAGDILYLADNAAEVFFDLPLLTFLGGKARVGYVVKESPVQNDLALGDLRLTGLRLPAEVIP
ncbi:MAG: ARMT1-like domain-containing protein, partial [Candidatus Hadarchaeaceae archaeon]